MATVLAENLKAAPFPKNTLLVVREDGRIYCVDFSERPQRADPREIDWDVSISKILLSKIQLTRSKHVTLEEIEMESVTNTLQNGAPKLTVLGSTDGKTDTITVQPIITENEGGFVQAKCRVTAKNFGVMLQGSYILNTVSVTVHQNGRR